MTKTILSSLFATTAFVMALPSQALAQAAPADDTASEDSGEIFVTARRENENLQDVPVSVQVVSGDQLEKLGHHSALKKFPSSLPALRWSMLVRTHRSPCAVSRGSPVRERPLRRFTSTKSVLIRANTIVSLFDVGQIEVLRGPQGTSRGAPSISGAVTILDAQA